MADYISQLRPASFRGLSFMMPSDDKASGRRIVTHEYPGRDEPSHEDLGASPNEFNIEAVIAGKSFLADADAFAAALAQKGAGSLVHPYYGSLNVIVTSPVRRGHSYDAVGEVRFQFTVQKYGEMIYPAAIANTVSGLSLASESLFKSIEAEFSEHFKIDGLQDFLLDDALGRLSTLSSTITSLMSKSGLIAAARQFLPPSWDIAGNLAGQAIGMFKSFAGSTKPKQKAVIGSSTVSSSTVSARSVLDVMTSATQINSGSVSGRAIRIDNAQALDLLFRAGALAAAAEAAKYATYDSREDALAVRNRVANNIESLVEALGNAGYDQSWRDSRNVLSAITRDISDRIGRLPKTVKIQSAAPRPSLALANRLYGDDPTNLFEKASDIASRNKVRHPGMIPVQPLEVLING